MATATRGTSTVWVDAAFARFQSGGLDAIRVEAIARDIGATKGSFYWHFSNRKALVAAVMKRWEVEQTDAMITAAEQSGDPRERLSRLFAAVAADRSRRGGELTLYASAAAEGVGETVHRVSERRITYVAELLAELGHDEADARRRATIALAAVVGIQQLVAAGGAALVGTDSDALTATALAMTTSPTGASGRLP